MRSGHSINIRARLKGGRRRQEGTTEAADKAQKQTNKQIKAGSGSWPAVTGTSEDDSSVQEVGRNLRVILSAHTVQWSFSLWAEGTEITPATVIMAEQQQSPRWL